MMFDAKVIQAYEQAKLVRERAHAPYSNFLVGSALKLKNDEEFYLGCNVENASYGATICAERNSVLNAIATNGKKEFEFIVLVCDTDPVSIPCGLCLQVLSEFVSADFPIYLSNLKGIQKKVTFKELMPVTFDTLFN
jgi:cytidine deaminase